MHLEIDKVVNLSKLHDELLTAGIAPERVDGNETTVRLTFADDTPQEIIDKVNLIVEEHDPAPLTQPPTPDERLAALETAILAMMGL